MRKIIAGKLYDTETAHEVGNWSQGAYGDLDSISETIYHKRTGEYFLHGRGGARTRYAHRDSLGDWTGGESITPLSPAKAREWAEGHLDTDAYESEFGTPDEGDGHVMTVKVSEATWRAVKALSVAQGRPMGAVIDAAMASLGADCPGTD